MKPIKYIHAIAFSTKHCKQCGERLGVRLRIRTEGGSFLFYADGDPFCWEESCAAYIQTRNDQDEKYKTLVLQFLRDRGYIEELDTTIAVLKEFRKQFGK